MTSERYSFVASLIHGAGLLQAMYSLRRPPAPARDHNIATGVAVANAVAACWQELTRLPKRRRDFRVPAWRSFSRRTKSGVKVAAGFDLHFYHRLFGALEIHRGATALQQPVVADGHSAPRRNRRELPDIGAIDPHVRGR